MEGLAKLALDEHGRIDVIFNNAGVMPTAKLRRASLGFGFRPRRGVSLGWQPHCRVVP